MRSTSYDKYIVYDAEKRDLPVIGTAPARLFNGPADVAEEICGGLAEVIGPSTLRHELENGGLRDTSVQYVAVGRLRPDESVPASLRRHRNGGNVTAIRITHDPDHGLVYDPVQVIADAAHKAAAA